MLNVQNRTGIYFLIKNCEVVYIGKTKVYPMRLKGHISQDMDFDSVRFVEVTRLDWLADYERRWIERFEPIHNKTYLRKKETKLNKILKNSGKTQIFKRMHFRKLTLKSTIGFGGWADYTVEAMLKHDKKLALIDMYFGYSHITFFDEILDLLKISPEWRISKPGTDKDKGYEFKHTIYPEETAVRKEQVLRKVRKNAREKLAYVSAVSIDKQWLKSRNQKG